MKNIKSENKHISSMPINLNDFNIISFDIFDTLVHRYTYAPMDVFDAVRSKLMTSQLALFQPSLIDNFPQLRRSSEQKAREYRLRQFGGDPEITFDEIYDQLVKQYPMDINTRVLLQDTELALERLFLYQSKEGFAKYSEAITLNKQVLFISDMYLPQNFLISVLQNLGFQAASEETVFISGDYRCNKHSGKLYQLVKETLNLEYQKWLHFGDNLHADVESARKVGLMAEHATWSKVNNVPRYSKKIADSLPESIVAGISLPQHHAIFHGNDKYQKLGYYIFAPLVFGFYVWLRKQLAELKPDKVLFFARDAYLIRQIDELLQQEENYPSEYVYLSRKSLYPLSLTDFPIWRSDFLVGGRASRTLSDICKNYSLDLSKFSVIMAQYGLSPTTIVNDGHTHYLVAQFISTCFTELMNDSVKNRTEFLSYFTDMLSDCKNIAIVDIGWVGNMQTAFARILYEQYSDIRLSGFYLGLLPNADRNVCNQPNMTGWFVNLNQNVENVEIIHTGGAELLEFLFTSPEGSTLGYRKDESGKVVPVLEEKNTQEQDYEQKALAVQQGVLAFMKDYAFLLREFPLEALDSLKWAEPFCELVRNPSREQICLLADLTHSDGAGDNQQRLPLAQKMPLFDRLFRTKKYRRAYEKSFWKRAFYYRNNRSPKKYRG